VDAVGADGIGRLEFDRLLAAQAELGLQFQAQPQMFILDLGQLVRVQRGLFALPLHIGAVFDAEPAVAFGQGEGLADLPRPPAQVGQAVLHRPHRQSLALPPPHQGFDMFGFEYAVATVSRLKSCHHVAVMSQLPRKPRRLPQPPPCHCTAVTGGRLSAAGFPPCWKALRQGVGG